MQQQSIFQWMSNRKNLFALTCIAAANAFFSPLEGKVTGKESLSLRRIAEFWKDGDFEIAKKQIIEFLDQFPESSARDHLCMMLGDLYFQEKKYQEAYSAYDQVTGADFKENTLFPKLYCLFQLRDYPGAAQVADLYFKTERQGDDALEAHFIAADSLVRVAIKALDPGKQLELVQQADLHAQKLAATKYENDFLFAYAEMQRMLKNYPQAISAYLKLAEQHPEKREGLLFQAASTQVFVDKAEAAKTFEKIIELKGKSAKAAAFNLLSLMLEAGRYQDLVTAYLKDPSLVPENKTALIQLYLGRSYFALNQFSEAKNHFLNFVSAETKNTPQLKSALVCLIHCAQNSKDIALLDQSLKDLKNSFPGDADYAKGLLLHAQISLELNDSKTAVADIQQILSEYPDFENQEALTFTSALLLSQEGRWQESKAAFLSFIEKFPESPQKLAAQRHLVNCSLQEDQKIPAIDEIRSVLLSDTLAENDRREFHFLLCKLLYETENHKESLAELEKYINIYARHATAAEAHLLSANCHQILGSQPEFFIFHAEKVIDLEPAFLNRNILHLHLFNAYLSIGNCEEKAADHLYQAFASGESVIKWENLVWLADYYLSRADQSETYMQRAETIFDSVSKNAADHAALEPIVLKYADKLGLKGRNAEKLALLKTLADKQRQQPQLAWRYQRRALFELAKCYEDAHEKEDALELYNELINSSTHASSYTGYAALLHRARLQFESLKSDMRNENNPQVLEILNELKDLQIKKNVQSEPLHLEAAITYAKIRSSLLSPEEAKEKSLFYFNRIKEDFTSEDDIISKDYKTSLKQFAEKDALFQTYMKYLDAEILKINGETEKAKEQLQALLTEQLHPYLRQRIQQEL